MSANKSSIVDLTENISRDYDQYFLKHNPFPQMGVSDDTPYFTVDREDVIKKFQYAVADLKKTEETNLTMLVGEYGSGKSHMLAQFKQSINAQLLNRNDGMIAAYVKNPGDEFRHIVTAMMDNIGLSKLSELVASFLSDVIQENDDVKNYCKKEYLQKYLNSEIDLSELMDESQIINVVKLLHKKYFKKIENADIVSAFLNLGHPEFSSISWKWFIGEKLDLAEQKQTNIKSPITNENAKRVFTDILTAFNIIGIRYFAMFLDEVEKISDLHITKKIKYHDDLRQVIDDHVKNVLFYFAITVKQWEKYVTLSTALSRRLVTNGVKLENFDVDLTQELIENYIAYGRTDSFTSKASKELFPNCEPSLAPFNSNSVKILHNKTDGVVYKILHACKVALEQAHDYPEKYSSVNDVILKKYS